MTGTRIGFQIRASTPPAELATVAAEAERLGYGEIWLAENYFELGGIAAVASALAATERAHVGLGVVSAAARHPAVAAMEFATLEGVYPGRFMAGIGHGAPHWVRQMGLEVASPLRLLRETAGAIRQLLVGNELNSSGEHHMFDRIHLNHAPAGAVPLYMGVHGPASLRLSGELADGTLLGRFSSPAYVAWARERIEEGRSRGGREGEHQLVVLCLLSLSEDDPIAARQAITDWAGPVLAGMAESPQLTVPATGSELLAHLDQEEGDVRLSEDLPDALLSQYVAAGDLAECAATVGRLFEAGADRVVLTPYPVGYRSTAAMIQLMRDASPLIRLRTPPDQA